MDSRKRGRDDSDNTEQPKPVVSYTIPKGPGLSVFQQPQPTQPIGNKYQFSFSGNPPLGSS